MRLNKPSPRLAIMRAQLAREAVTLKCDRIMYANSAQNPRVSRAPPPVAEDLPLPPSYDEDLAEWLKMLRAQPASKTQQPAAPAPKPIASAWRRGADIPESERLGLWHDARAADLEGVVGKVGCAKHAEGLLFNVMMYRPAAPGTKEGDPYDESRYAAAAQSAKPADAGSAENGDAMVVAKLTHSVCIKEHVASGHLWRVGNVLNDSPNVRLFPENWRACDKDGWIPHIPMADSVCPVPESVAMIDICFKHGLMLYKSKCDKAWTDTKGNCNIAAWRPVEGGEHRFNLGAS